MTERPILKIYPRTAVSLVLASAIGAGIFLWPLVLRPASVLAADQAAPILLAVILAVVLLIVFVDLGFTGVDARTVALLGLLCAVGAVLRPLSAGSAGIEFVFFFILLGGRAFGPGFGFVLGSATLFASAFLTAGLGPWLPYQMLAASWIGMGAGLLPHRLRGRAEIVVLCEYGALAGFLYGQVMNLSFWPFVSGPGTAVSFVPGGPVQENLRRFVLFSLGTSLGWDLIRAATLALGVAAIGSVTLRTLRRVTAPSVFLPSPQIPGRPVHPRDPSEPHRLYETHREEKSYAHRHVRGRTRDGRGDRDAQATGLAGPADLQQPGPASL